VRVKLMSIYPASNLRGAAISTGGIIISKNRY